MELWHTLKNKLLKHPEEEEIIETIEEIMEQREERGDSVLVDPHELLLVKNLFKMKELRAAQIMIPRVDIKAVPVTMTKEELADIILQTPYTRLLVYEKTLDNIVGLLHLKDFLKALLKKEKIDISQIMIPTVLFVPPSIRALDLLREMQTNRTQLAVVIDEHGGTNGLITLEDLMEVIVGEIEDERDMPGTTLLLKKINKTTVEADAKVLLEDLEKLTGKFWGKEVQEMEIDTIGGLVSYIAKRLPHKGEIITAPNGVTFHILDGDSRRLKVIRITKIGHRFLAPKSKEKK